MPRVKFGSGQQKLWILEVLVKSGLTLSELTSKCGFNRRTLNGWKNEETTIPKSAGDLIALKTGISLPSNAQILKDYWNSSTSGRIAAYKRIELYGPPGTRESRAKGGRVSQIRRKQHPENYRNCKIRKEYVWPQESEDLAELTGILLGDGGISYDQIKISLNGSVEKEYVQYVSQLINELFHEHPKIFAYKDPLVKVCNVTLSGIALVEFFIRIGLGRGNKVRRQVCVPEWITKNLSYSIAALRGLIDTDGGVFYHDHKINGKSYYNIGLTFTSRSRPLLDFVQETLLKIGLHAKLSGDGVYLYRIGEVLEYERIVKFGNTHHIERLKNFSEQKRRHLEE